MLSAHGRTHKQSIRKNHVLWQHSRFFENKADVKRISFVIILPYDVRMRTKRTLDCV